MMAGTEYTLTGFDDFLERRRVAFVQPLPRTRVCGACGVVPSRSLFLPCGHTLCQACKICTATGDQQCPMDGTEFAEAAVVSINFKQSDLEQHRVFCLVGGRECSFSGRLGDLKEHLVGCCNDKVRCSKCQQYMLRCLAAQHCRQCDAKAAPQQSASATAIANTIEKLGSMKRDLEIIRQRASTETVDQDAVVNGANSLVERMTCLERELFQKGKASGEQRDLLPAVKNTAVTAGPYRAASKPGVFVSTCKFSKIYSGYNAVIGGKRDHQLSTENVMAGYVFQLVCKFQKQGNEDVLIAFILFLGDGSLDDLLEWPFAKKVTAILSHPRDQRKDVRLPVKMEDPETLRKPAPGSWNDAGDIKKIRDGMTSIEALSCLRFVERTTEDDYIFIDFSKGCSSFIGRQGGKQVLSLEKGCLAKATVMHELLHAAGFYHEHSRSDRDDYVVIFPENVKEGKMRNFNKRKPSENRLLTPFDLKSVMLYGSDTFSRAPGLATILTKDGKRLPQTHDKKSLSASDTRRIRMLYKCRN
ncbi:hypothetical protein V5799_032251 [Amblyomma americanum]|uniref:Metalloendopeptidase n=1 Tax=Amblyomma americanum TaxID=6943 RepID=A0AAQ4DRQ0_AMBAM